MGPLSLSSFRFEIEPNKSLELSPKVRLQFVLRSIAGARFALVIRRRNSTLCYVSPSHGISRWTGESTCGGFDVLTGYWARGISVMLTIS